MTTQRALVAFPLRGEPAPDDKRGYVLACAPRDGRIASLMRNGLNQPPVDTYPGLWVWEGNVYLEGETVPHNVELANRWRSGVLWDGEWRRLRTDEWDRIYNGSSPW